MKDTITKIIKKSVYAPSADNCQPWRFEVKDNNIYVYNIPEKDYSLYGSRQRPSFFAHGALIENISIVSLELDYEATISLFPNDDNNLVAIISFTSAEVSGHHLSDFVDKRITNRKLYNNEILEENIFSELLSVAGDVNDLARAIFVQDYAKKEELAKVGAANEQILLKNKLLHQYFFNSITWTEEEDKERSGFYIKTFEFVPAQEKMFKLIKNWRLLSFLNLFGLPNFVAKENAKIYNASSAMGLIVMNGKTPGAFVEAGRVMQRIWLTAAKLGLYVQPLAGIAFLKLLIEDGDGNFSSRQIDFINSNYEIIKNNFGLKNEVAGMMFRIGKAEEPSAKTNRLSPEIVFHT